MKLKTALETKELGGKFTERVKNNFSSEKIKKKSEFILNSGNSYVTLQPELCLGGLWNQGSVMSEQRFQGKQAQKRITI